MVVRTLRFAHPTNLAMTPGLLLHRRLRGEARAAYAQAPARVLPQLLARMQVAERARDGAEVVVREALRHVGVVERLLVDGLQDLLRQRFDGLRIAGLARDVGL